MPPAWPTRYIRMFREHILRFTARDHLTDHRAIGRHDFFAGVMRFHPRIISKRLGARGAKVLRNPLSHFIKLVYKTYASHTRHSVCTPRFLAMPLPGSCKGVFEPFLRKNAKIDPNRRFFCQGVRSVKNANSENFIPSPLPPDVLSQKYIW